jgi:uncharacterized cupredoxin-like copper-binding protein
MTQIADIGAYERANDPEPFAIDANLYGLDVAADGAVIVADAGGNTVYRVDPASGDLALLAVIPGVSPPAGFEAPEGGNPFRGGALELDPVPTGVAVAADGSILVGQLGSLVTDAGQVVHLAADGALGEIVSGLTNVVDVKIGPDGAPYVSEISTDFEAEIPAPGAVVRLAADGTPETVLADLPFPNGLAFAADGALYVVINTVSFGPPQGQVLRCELESAAAQPDMQTIELHDFAFSPSTITIPANTEVTLRLVNRGFAVHDFTIADLSISSPTIRPGRSATVVVTAAPGTYRIACAVPGHLAHGMVGTVQAMTG